MNKTLKISIIGLLSLCVMVGTAGVSHAAVTISATTVTNTAGVLTLTAGAASTWSTSAGDLTVDSAAGSLILDSGEATADAVRIVSSDAAGGFDFDAGTGGINIATTSTTADAFTILASGVVTDTALNLTTTDGRIEIDANGTTWGDVLVTAVDDITLTSTDATVINPTGVLTLTAGAASTWSSSTGALTITSDDTAIWSVVDNNLTLEAGTNTPGKLHLISDQAAADAIHLDADGNAAGGITVDFGTGNMILTGTGASADFTLDGDLFSIDGIGVSNITVTADAGAEDFTIAQAGTTASGLFLSSAGSGVDALSISTAHATGDIKIDSSNDITIDAVGVLGIDVTAATGDSNITVTGAGIDLNIGVAGGGAQVLKLDSAGTGEDAIDISSVAGGVDIDAANTKDVAITGGQITLLSSHDTASSISLTTGAGTSETLVITNASGTAAGAVTIAATGAGTGTIVINADGIGTDAINIDAEGGIDIDIADAGRDFVVTSALGSILLDTSEAGTDQIKLHAQGAHGSDVINLVTVDGGIILTAAGATPGRGNITFAAENDVTIGSSTAAGVINIGSTNTNTHTIGIGTVDAIQTINIGTHATPINVVTVGGTASRVIAGGKIINSGVLQYGTNADDTYTAAELKANRVILLQNAAAGAHTYNFDGTILGGVIDDGQSIEFLVINQSTGIATIAVTNAGGGAVVSSDPTMADDTVARVTVIRIGAAYWVFVGEHTAIPATTVD